MKDGETLVFIEVKARSNNAYGMPCEAVDLRKRHHIVTAAEQFLCAYECENQPARFDVMEVNLTDRTVRHIRGAFCADE